MLQVDIHEIWGIDRLWTRKELGKFWSIRVRFMDSV